MTKMKMDEISFIGLQPSKVGSVFISRMIICMYVCLNVRHWRFSNLVDLDEKGVVRNCINLFCIMW